MKDWRAQTLSVLVPGRNEMFMRHTCEDVLAHSGEDTEVIAILDGYTTDLPSHPRLRIMHFEKPVGQRAATNYGAKDSQAKYIMKLDAHCAVDDGFDAKLIAKMEPDMTMIPAMHRLHVFDWHCNGCGERTYQGTMPRTCSNEDCAWDGTEGKDQFTMIMVWTPRFQYSPTVSWLFDKELHFQYWRKYPKTARFKEQAPSGIVETMSCIGCCFLMERERFLGLGGMEDHGNPQGWGQFGTELACKAWLSGGRMVTNLDTWIAHLFRTGNFGQNGESSWPYPINQRDIDAARKHSRELWLNDKWPLAVRPLQWLIDYFKPIPGWHS